VRQGALAVPLYFVAVGVAHVALALIWSERTTGLPRDGQAFSGTAVLGVGFVFLGLLAFAPALALERSLVAFTRAMVSGLVVAMAVVAYTASRGYLMGGTTGAAPCITEPSGPVCAPGAGTYIADAQPDPLVMLFAAVAAWALAHAAARLQGRRRSVPGPVATRP
jgi:4-amino-4-deoxy-L-arabinose transferase-like glycosyltransferase